MTAIELAGWIGQACFFSRFLIQWVLSEKARESVSPRVFWKISVFGSFLLAIYTFAQAEYVLLAGSVINGAIAIRNLQIGGSPRQLGRGATAVLGLVAIVSTVVAGVAMPSGEGPPPLWLACVMIGQALWSSRFVVQWWASERRGESHFPLAFWWISLVGNTLLLAYAIHRRDAILVSGYVIGPLVQVRNLMLMYAARRRWRAMHGAEGAQDLREYVLPGPAASSSSSPAVAPLASSAPPIERPGSIRS